jgi:tagatose-6-phosphate ketose/aldose isomerase
MISSVPIAQIWISFPRSGDSPGALAVVQSALERFPLVRHILITCNRQSGLVREFGTHPSVLLLVLSDKVNDRGLAMTSSFSNMVVAGQCLEHLHSQERYRDVLWRIRNAAGGFIGPCADLAEQNFSKACFPGTGSLKAAARESLEGSETYGGSGPELLGLLSRPAPWPAFRCRYENPCCWVRFCGPMRSFL